MKAYIKSADGHEIMVLDTILESEMVNTLKNVLRIVEFMPDVRNHISELRIAFNEGDTGWVEKYEKEIPNSTHGRRCRDTSCRGYYDKSLADCCERDFEV